MISYPARARISRSAFLHNLNLAREATDVMAVVKADGYGHGMARIARWAVDAGVSWLGVANVAEALELRSSLGEGPRILAWIIPPDHDLAPALTQSIDLSIGSLATLAQVEEAARATGLTVQLHLEIDTGMARGGANMVDVAAIAQRIGELEAEGVLEFVGLWSHLACADDADPAPTNRQIILFEEARRIVQSIGISPQVHHLANSAGVLWHPATHYDLARPGIMLYGLSPNPELATATELGLKPVMRLEADVTIERDVPAGTGISYGHTEITQSESHLAVVPLGYADGIPRAASRRGYVELGGRRTKVLGNICMDQFIVDAPGAHVGDTAVIFGADGTPTADEWAAASSTIGYEIIVRLGNRVLRIDAE